jgi:hypothetical protein
VTETKNSIPKNTIEIEIDQRKRVQHQISDSIVKLCIQGSTRGGRDKRDRKRNAAVSLFFS